jgi:hypothetical protein
MARIPFFRLSLISLSKISTRKLLVAINLGIFFSIFAVSASIISIYFENRIDKIENRIIEEETSYIVYNSWLNRIPKTINEVNAVLDQKEQIENYTPLLKALIKHELWSFYGNRQNFFNHYFYLRDLIEINFQIINLSLSDALLVASSLKDIELIIEKRSEKNKLIKKFDEAFYKRISYRRSHLPKTKSGEISYETYYLEYADFNKELRSLILSQRKYFIEFALKYFSLKKLDFQKHIITLQNEIGRLSKLESRFILSAFFVQFIIFLLVQFFEITIEQENINRKKKK